MICTKCKQDGVENTALGKTFWYCRACKEEIHPESLCAEPTAYRDIFNKIFTAQDSEKPEGISSPIALDHLLDIFYQMSEERKKKVPARKLDDAWFIKAVKEEMGLARARIIEDLNRDPDKALFEDEDEISIPPQINLQYSMPCADHKWRPVVDGKGCRCFLCSCCSSISYGKELLKKYTEYEEPRAHVFRGNVIYKHDARCEYCNCSFNMYKNFGVSCPK